MIIDGIDHSQLQLVHEGPYNWLYRSDTPDEKAVVLVKLAKSPSPLSRQAELFANELDISRRIDHPGIRKALKTGSSDGRPFIRLEYIDGPSLNVYCSETKPGPVELLATGTKIAENLAVLHGHDVIYKNLNSSHILMGPDLQPVLINFTLALRCTLSHAADRPDRLEGDLAFMSPEQTGRINRVVDYRSDLYSLGVVLYDMFAGRLPFTSTTTPELIHDHIARKPQPVCDINPDVPEAVSAIIMKLLLKNPEERYQSAFAVARDLERCRHQLQTKGRIMPFDPGRDDVSDKLLIPRSLYGRQKELECLEKAFDRVLDGAGETVLVSGSDGTGKTLLVNELKRRVMAGGGLFLTGNYDQYQRNIPYKGLNQVFSAFAGRLSDMGPGQLAALRSMLRQATESCGELIRTVLPGLHLLRSGPSQPEEQIYLLPVNRTINDTLCSVLRLLSREFSPLVLFLDNLQWADSGSLEVVRKLSEGKDGLNILTIGAYNDTRLADKGVQEGLRVDHLAREDTVECLHLGNLDRGSLRSLVQDMVQRSDQETTTFSDIVFDKTGGNPLLAVEFIQSLYEDGALRFDFDAGRWYWDEAMIREHAVVDNVLDSVIQKIKGLSEPAGNLLMAAACAGNAFSLEPLAELLNLDPGLARTHMKEAEEEYLVLSFGDIPEPNSIEASTAPFLGSTRFAFSHARVRQAAYAMMPLKNKRMIHLKLGRLYMARLSEPERNEHIFTITDQFNEGFRYIETQEERLRLAKLNCAAGKRARLSGAFKASVWYLNMGLGLLPRDRWKHCRELTRRLFEEAVQAEYLSCNFSRVHMLSEELAAHAEDGPGRAKAIKYQVLAHAAKGDQNHAYASALKALEALDILTPEELPEVSAQTPESPGQLDTATIIKASHMLSREIHPDRLREKFMQIVMENAGAGKGVLIIKQHGRMMIQARRKVGDKKGKAMAASPLTGSPDVPHSLINTVMATKRAVVIGDACSDPEYAQDEYIRMHSTRSMLGLPIVHQTKLMGILYLENNLASNVFDMDHVQLLNTLLSQAAISMENAMLYTDLGEKLKELRKTQDALVESRNWLDRIINSIPEPIFVKDRQHRWVLLNDALCEFTGNSRDDLLGKSDHDFFPRKEADVFWARDEQVFTSGKDNENEETLSDAKGKSHTIITRKTLYTDEKGNPYIVGIIRDITERVNLENQLRQAVKMEAIGKLAGGVAHDFNNMLSVILGYSEMALEQTDLPEPLHESLEAIIDAARRSADITRQLLAFARKQTISPKVVDINKTLTGMTRMLQRLIGEDIDLAWLPGEDVRPIMIDPGQIDQILANLCINARDAIKNVGRVTIETGNADFEQEDCHEKLGFQPGRYMVLSISDNGCGIPPDILDSIFDPFFTTKASGRGTGLGLSTVYGIVRQNNGFINVYSEQGKGTTFKIYFPHYEVKGGGLPDTGVTHPIKRGHETILLVEDESAILGMTEKMLEGLGYTVKSARTPGEALALAREQDEVHLVLTDVIMPEMNGRDLAENVLSIHPHARCMFMSGYTADIISHHGVLDKGVNFLQKPFSKKQLGSSVREVLDGDKD